MNIYVAINTYNQHNINKLKNPCTVLEVRYTAVRRPSYINNENCFKNKL